MAEKLVLKVGHVVGRAVVEGGVVTVVTGVGVGTEVRSIMYVLEQTIQTMGLKGLSPAQVRMGQVGPVKGQVLEEKCLNVKSPVALDVVVVEGVVVPLVVMAT